VVSSSSTSQSSTACVYHSLNRGFGPPATSATTSVKRLDDKNDLTIQWTSTPVPSKRVHFVSSASASSSPTSTASSTHLCYFLGTLRVSRPPLTLSFRALDVSAPCQISHFFIVSTYSPKQHLLSNCVFVLQWPLCHLHHLGIFTWQFLGQSSNTVTNLKMVTDDSVASQITPCIFSHLSCFW
jgi:hypothetical protein